MREGIFHRKIALIVDNPRRDLRGLTLVAYHLAKNDAEVLLVPMYAQRYDLPLLDVDTIVVNYARTNNQYLLKLYRKLSRKVVVLDTEGGVLSEHGLDSPVEWADHLVRTGINKLVDLYLFWGEKVYSVFHRKSVLHANSMEVTGCPRYDICRPPWNSVLNRDLIERDNYVLINMNFSAINPRFTESAQSEKKIFKDQGWDEEYIDNYFMHLSELFSNYLAVIHQISKLLPKIKFLIRPHPFEDEKFYIREFSHATNVVIKAEGDIFDALYGASTVLHLNCGTAVDARRMGKVPVSLEFLNNDYLKRHTPLPSEVSYKVYSMNELVNVLNDKGKLHDADDDSIANEIIKPWFFHSDGLASLRVADAIIKMSTNGKIRKSRVSAIFGAREMYLLSPLKLLFGLSCYLFGSKIVMSVSEKLGFIRRGKGISLGEVRSLVESYSSVDKGVSLCVNEKRRAIVKSSCIRVYKKP